MSIGWEDIYLYVRGSEESVSGPSVLVNTVYYHSVVIQLGESDSQVLQSCLIVHHTSLHRESQHAVTLHCLVNIEVTVMVLRESG